MSEKFNEPRLALNRIYTKGGDYGETSLVGGQRVSKDNLRIETYGTIDELNSFIGLARLSATDAGLHDLSAILLRIQHELFNLGSILATLPQDVHPAQPRITPVETEQLEKEIDAMNAVLQPLRSFVLPGGTRLSAELHVCRTVVRRAERILVALSKFEEVPEDAIRYCNRLSDAFFVFSRWANHASGVPELLWQPNKAASATNT
ncbi:cob(I)yrinic acid a,c-diamide adenosyltransferase [Bryobacterales bacterium F-183]|nr:cob(I)yrinic acid a,c-diamide adenosyltransferase [Bryobacterales bacterium F-183]